MKLKKLTFATYIALGSLGLSSAFAAANILPVGPNIGYGDASNNNTIYSSTANPAWTGGNLHIENNVGFALGGTIRFEQKEFNSLINTYNDKVKPLLDDSSGGSNAIANAIELQQEVTGLILDTRDNFYLQADTALSLPIQATRDGWGGFGLELSGYSSARARLLSTNKPITINTSGLTASSTSDDIINAATVQSAFYLKTTAYTEVAFTYGNQFFENQHGRLSVGIKAKAMNAKLVKSVNSLKKYLEASANNEDIGDQLNDDFKAHTDVSDTENQVGVDIGAQWIATNWMAGFTVMNVNSPTFNFNDLSTAGVTSDAFLYRDQINLTESVELKPQSRIEAALFSENRNWTLAASADLNVANDLLNNEYQWASTSISYASDSSGSWLAALVPDIRVGYRSNLAGDERSYITPGFTWGPLNLDLGFESFEDLSKLSNLGKTSEDNVDLPEGLMLGLALEFYF